MSKKKMLFSRSSGSPFLANLSAYYPLNSDANDYTGVNNGVPYLITYGSGKVGNAAIFAKNIVHTYIDIPDNDSLSFTNGGGVDVPMTICMWVNMSLINTGNWFINKRGATSGTDEWQFAYFSNKIIFGRYDRVSNSIYQEIKSSASLLSLNTWYHIAVTDDGSKNINNMKMYLNGSLITTTKTSAGVYTGMPNGTYKVKMGRASWDNNPALAHDGKLDEVAIWKNRQLTDAEVLEAYNLGNAGTPLIS